MSADLLRRAAASMREKADSALLACGDERWNGDAGIAWNDSRGTVYMVGAGPVNVADAITEESALYIASWHPAVALAVADLLDRAASYWIPDPHGEDEDVTCCCCPHQRDVVKLARAYLGESA